MEILYRRLQELESSLHTTLHERSAERKGRIRAQQALRKAFTDKSCADIKSTSYPMTPIAVIQSCFSTRNGTPRQPLLVSHARACLILNSNGVPPAALEGLAEYSHCWILYVFHKNTDMARLWEQPAHMKFKAKVRVPRLQGGKMGVLATRSPHRPCPIGLTVAKVEAVHGRMLLLSGVDLVDGTPVLDIKPYLPYCDNVQDARVPDWVMAEGMYDQLVVASVIFSHDFSTSLASCWEIKGNQSLYSSPNEFQILIEQILSRDIRSLCQRMRPHKSNFDFLEMALNAHGGVRYQRCTRQESCRDEFDESATITAPETNRREILAGSSKDVVYNLILEGIIVSYTIDDQSNVVIQYATLSSDSECNSAHECNHMIWSNAVSRCPHEAV
eukprot:Gb_24489 [translate_table: standard]